MQQDADFITVDFLYMFQASSAHHQEYKILTRQQPVQVVMVCRWILTSPYGGVRIHLQPQLPVLVAAVSVFYTPDYGRLTPETCRESLQ